MTFMNYHIYAKYMNYLENDSCPFSRTVQSCTLIASDNIIFLTPLDTFY